jgi:RND family efflux transporter MFP subunit
MKMSAPALAILLVFVSCRGRQPAATEAPRGEEPIRVTRWSDRTELFLEYPPLAKGRSSRFAIHLTNLSDFKPLADGRVDVELLRDGRLAATAAAEKPSRPGIFGADVRVDQAGVFELVIRVSSTAATDRHEVGPVAVYGTESEAARAPRGAPDEETVAFLKEQQWTLDFATEVVRERVQRSSVRVPAEIEPRTGGVAEVTVPFAARLVRAGDPPALGTSVQKGQVLGGLLPPTSNPADLPALELARAEAQAALELGRKERARVERLAEVGAIPVRRLDEARAVETTTAARLKAAEARIAHYEATRAAEGESPPGTRVFLLRAPISGVVAETHGTSGANVEAGENLFKIVEVDRVFVTGSIPESEAPVVRRLAGAELEIPGVPAPRPAGRLVSAGQLVDARTRAFKVIYEVENRNRSLAVGQPVFLRLFTSESRKQPAVPETAVVDDAGRPTVFVQRGGESFARRPVRLGNRGSGYVEVLEGVRTGERVVSRGAYLIRLAALSTELPAHGHVH